MLTGEVRSQIDSIWNTFWTGGISNPLEVIEQITYLLFLKRLDDLHTLEENKAARLKTPIERRIFPEGADPKGRPYEDLRWSRFKNFAPAEMFTVVSDHVFPFLRTLGGDDSTYAHHMKDARFRSTAFRMLHAKEARSTERPTKRFELQPRHCSARKLPR
jgi:type I restriction enzyme M protein